MEMDPFEILVSNSATFCACYRDDCGKNLKAKLAPATLVPGFPTVPVPVSLTLVVKIIFGLRGKFAVRPTPMLTLLPVWEVEK